MEYTRDTYEIQCKYIWVDIQWNLGGISMSSTGAGASRLGAHGFDERRTEKVSHLVQIAGQAGARAQSFGSFCVPALAEFFLNITSIVLGGDVLHVGTSVS